MAGSARPRFVVPGTLLVLALLLEAAAVYTRLQWLSFAALAASALGLLAAVWVAGRWSRKRPEAPSDVAAPVVAAAAEAAPRPEALISAAPTKVAPPPPVPAAPDQTVAPAAEPIPAAEPETAATPSQPAPEPAPTPMPVPAPAPSPAPAPAPTPAPAIAPGLSALAAPRSLEPQPIVEALFEAVGAAGTPVASHLWLLDPPSATLRLIAAAGPFAPPAVPIPVSDSSLGVAVSRGAATVTPPPIAERSTTPTRTRFAVPVTTGSARGVAAVDFYDTSPPDLEVLIRVFASASGVLAGTLGLFVAQDDNRRAHLLAEATRELAGAMDEETIVRLTLDNAVALSGAATGSVMLVDMATGRMHIAASRGLPGDVVENTGIEEGDGIAGWVLATRQPMLVEDPAPEPTDGHLPRHGVRSSLSVPILDSGAPMGVLNVGTRAYPARFTDDHTDTLCALAAQCAAALRHVRSRVESERIYLDTLQALVRILESRDPLGHGDADRIARLSEALGSAVGMDESQRKTLRIAALLHDIGMDFVAPDLTGQDRPLSLTQRGLVAMHPSLGAEFLTEVPGLAEAAPLVAHHHERFDGSGYGSGLSGDAIPMGARVLAVADAFTAMTSERPHRPAMSAPEAMAEIERNAGTQFDPRVVIAFTDLARREPQLLAS